MHKNLLISTFTKRIHSALSSSLCPSFPSFPLSSVIELKKFQRRRSRLSVKAFPLAKGCLSYSTLPFGTLSLPFTWFRDGADCTPMGGTNDYRLLNAMLLTLGHMESKRKGALHSDPCVVRMWAQILNAKVESTSASGEGGGSKRGFRLYANGI